MSLEHEVDVERYLRAMHRTPEGGRSPGLAAAFQALECESDRLGLGLSDR